MTKERDSRGMPSLISRDSEALKIEKTLLEISYLDSLSNSPEAKPCERLARYLGQSIS